jgi:hypothetical protein
MQAKLLLSGNFRKTKERGGGKRMINERHYIYRKNIFRSIGSQKQAVRPFG